MRLSLLELIVAAGTASVVLLVAVALSLYGLRSFAAIGNYCELDAKNRLAADVLGRELRQASAVVAFETNLPVKWLTLTNTGQNPVSMKVTWDSNAHTLVFDQTGHPSRTLLAECDSWDFALFNRVAYPSQTNILLYSATNSAGQLDPAFCKLLSMSWKCSRTTLNQNTNTEGVRTAQIVLRNKMN